MFICRVHAAPNEAQDVLFAESINAPRLMGLSVSESTLSNSQLTDCSGRFVPQACSTSAGARRLGEPQRNRGSTQRRAPAKSLLYGLFTTTCGARLLTSSWALTLWI
jgi:hypothetical protein